MPGLPGLRRGITLAVALAGAVVSSCGGGGGADLPPPQTVATAPAPPREEGLCGPLDVRITGRVRTGAATELSGLAFSHADRDVLWTHNDSGDGPRLLAVTTRGRLAGEVAVTGAEAVDWEDMAAGPDRTLIVADIGDNEEARPSVVLYRLAEPRVPGTTAARAERLELRYPDRPHNAETLLVDPRSGAVVIVTKVHPGERVAAYTAPRPAASAPTTLRRAGALRIDEGLVTAGSVSGDGRTIVLRSYTSAFVWRRRGGEPLARTVLRAPDCVADAGLLAEGQGEAIVLSPRGSAFYTVPEGPRPAIRRYERATNSRG